MASVNDIGTPGQPLSSPPLIDWAEAVRDAFNGSDVTVDQRITNAFTKKLWTGTASTVADSTLTCSFMGAVFTAAPMVFLTGWHTTYRVSATVVSTSPSQVVGRVSVSGDGTNWSPSGTGFIIQVLAVGTTAVTGVEG